MKLAFLTYCYRIDIVYAMEKLKPKQENPFMRAKRVAKELYEGLVWSSNPDYQRALIQEIVIAKRERRSNKTALIERKKILAEQCEEAARLVAENPEGKSPIVNFPVRLYGPDEEYQKFIAFLQKAHSSMTPENARAFAKLVKDNLPMIDLNKKKRKKGKSST